MSLLIVFYRNSLLIISCQNFSLHIADFILVKLLSYVSKIIFCFASCWSFHCTSSPSLFSCFFDTIDCNILFHRLLYWFGFLSTGLNLLSSFLAGRSQIFVTSKLKSQPNLLEYDVPLGCVLGPLIYSLYTTSFLTVISNYPGI